MVVMEIEDGKVQYEHICWDQCSLLAQARFSHTAGKGQEQARKLLDPISPSNELMERAKQTKA